MTLDEHVRQRINAELARLKAQEEEIQDKIARALEKEKLDREAAAANDGSSKQEDRIKSSTALQQELAELKKKIDINREKRDLERNFPEIAKARSQLLACYRDKRDRPLDCWAEAADFRTAVKQAEQVRFPIICSPRSDRRTLCMPIPYELNWPASPSTCGSFSRRACIAAIRPGRSRKSSIEASVH